MSRRFTAGRSGPGTESLNYAAEVLNLGTEAHPEPDLNLQQSARAKGERHLTGQELCQAIRQYAVNQYGFMAKVVLNNWGVSSTGDFGNIVYNMINVGLMKKSKNDRRSHFDNVFDFDEVFEANFEICKAPAPRHP